MSRNNLLLKDDLPVLVESRRSGVVECKHRGSIVVVENGKVVQSIGNPHVVTPMRSTAKPFQILPLLKLGGADYYYLSPREIAVMVSSHNGEDTHVNTIRSLLNKASLEEKQLMCGTHPAYFQWITQSVFKKTGEDVKPIHNNCSGKHTGMLLLCKLQNISIENYWEYDHPIQQLLINAISKIINIDAKDLSIGVDGCGVPTYNIELIQLAHAYYALSDPTNSPFCEYLELVGKSMMAEPFMVGGSDRLDSDLMQHEPVIAKVGSEGIYCVSIPDKKMSIAIKIESGSEEAACCAAVEMLKKLGVISDKTVSLLEKYWHRPIITFTGIEIGSYQPVF